MTTVRQAGDVQVVELTGEISIGTSSLGRTLDLHGKRIDDVGDTLERLVSVERPRVLIDLRQVSFIDSAGVGTLIELKKKAVKQGGDIKLLVDAGAVKRVLRLLNLEQVFDIYDDESDALSSF